MRVLNDMAPYLNRFRDGENVYYLNEEGRARVGCKRIAKKSIQARHYLMRNEIFIAFQQPDFWKNEVKFSVDDEVTLIVDAWFKANERYFFLEVDHTAKMCSNRIKIEKYRKFRETNAYQDQYGYFPELLWITTTEYRREQLRKLCETNGLQHDIFTVDDFR
jgi:Replication-relaxation